MAFQRNREGLLLDSMGTGDESFTEVYEESTSIDRGEEMKGYRERLGKVAQPGYKLGDFYREPRSTRNKK